MQPHGKIAFVLLLFLVLFSPEVPNARAAETASIAGKVHDARGALVQGVDVAAVDRASSIPNSTKTDKNGAYILVLAPGSYNVTYSASGFEKAEIRNIVLIVGQSITIDMTLTIGPEEEVVLTDWSASKSPVQGSAAGNPQGERAITDLPLSSRNYTQAAGLASGVSSQVSNATAMGMNSQGVQVGSGSSTSYLMDGVAVADSPGGTDAAAVPSPDAIESDSTQSWSYSPGPERYSGANISVVTKSGANTFHGTLFEFVRNDIFNANDFFLKRQGLPKPVLKQNQFGFTFGGPIKKDRAFFFLAYQGTRQRNGFAAAGYSPSATLPPLPNIRNAATVGSALCPPNHPGDSRYTTLLGGTQVACDGSNINSVALNLLNLKLTDGTYFIPGSGTGTFQTVPKSIPAPFREDQVILNTDVVLSEKQKLTQKFYYSHDPQTMNFTGGSNALPGSRLKVLNGAIYGLVRLSSSFTANLLNDLFISTQLYEMKRTPQVPFTNDQVGIASIVPQINILDTINVAGLFGLGGGNLWEDNNVNHYQISDQASWIHGRHTIRFGAEVYKRQWNIRVPAYARGSLSVGSFADLLLGLPGCPPGNSNCSVANPVVNGVRTNGSAFSNVYGSLGAGGTTAYVTAPSGINHAFRYTETSWYFQDAFQIRPRLTLTAGLRWDYFGHPTDKTGNMTNFWPTLGNPWAVPPPGGTYQGYLVPFNFSGSLPAGVVRNTRETPFPGGASLLHFAPRLSFSAQPFSEINLVIRGGYGHFYDRPDSGKVNQQPMAAVPYAVPVGGSGQANYQASLSRPYPQKTLGWGTARAVDFTTGESTNLSMSILDEDFSVPLTQKWNLEIQQQLAGGLTVVIGYAGAHSIHLQNVLRQINVARLASPSSPVNGITNSTVKNASLRVPILGIASNGLNNEQTQGSAKYNGFQAAISERTRNGLHVQATYMFSKTLSNLGAAPPLPGAPSNQASAGMNSNDPLDAGQQYGPSLSSAPMRLAVNYGWDFPWKRQGVAGRLLNGWGVSGMTILQSGTPMTISDSRGGTIYGNASVSRAQFCAGMSAMDVATLGGVKDRLSAYFNKAAFCAPPTVGDGTGYGDSGVGIILGPGQFNTDLAISRGLEIKRSKVEFRAEFFNTFNHPQFGLPDLSVTNAAFGQITSTSVNPRLIQFGLKYSF